MGAQEWKLLHVASVVVFLGNLVTSLHWAARAGKTRDLAIAAHTFEQIRAADRWFTLPGAVGITIAGVAAAWGLDIPIFGTGWVLWGIGFFGIGLTILATVRAGLQSDLHEFARSETTDQASWMEFDFMYRYWRSWTVGAIVAALAAVLMMVYRPSLPAF